MSIRILEESNGSSIAKYKWKKVKNSFQVPVLISEGRRANNMWLAFSFEFHCGWCYNLKIVFALFYTSELRILQKEAWYVFLNFILKNQWFWNGSSVIICDVLFLFSEDLFPDTINEFWAK